MKCCIISEHLRERSYKNRSEVGAYNDEGPPVPIPNTAVKLISAEDTRLEAARENKSLPTLVSVFFSILCKNKTVFVPAPFRIPISIIFTVFLLSSVGRAPDC